MNDNSDPAPIRNDDERRPYAAAANVIGVLDRIKKVNLPDTIDPDFLRVTRVPEQSLGRTLEALRFLGFVEPNGKPTDTLRSMAGATDDDFHELLAGSIRAAYASDFARVNPAVDTQVQIASQFRRYQPRSQTTRMVMLFLALNKAAGLPVVDAPRQRAMNPSAAGPRTTNRGRPRKNPEATRSMAGVATGTGSAHGARVITGAGHQVNPDLIFGVTIEDLDYLPEGEFEDVWSALGKVARARARAHRQLAEAAEASAERARTESSGDAGG